MKTKLILILFLFLLGGKRHYYRSRKIRFSFGDH